MTWHLSFTCFWSYRTVSTGTIEEKVFQRQMLKGDVANCMGYTANSASIKDGGGGSGGAGGSGGGGSGGGKSGGGGRGLHLYSSELNLS
jgi:hypothetical protein